MHEIAFAVETSVALRSGRAALVPRIVKHRVPRFGVVGHKLAQIAANRPDLPIPNEIRGVLDDTLAREESDGGGVRASVATVSRSACGKFAVKRINDPFAPGALRAASAIVGAILPDLDARTLAPLADEFDLASELRKNRDLRRALCELENVVVPRVLSADAREVVMDYEVSVLARDAGVVPLAAVRAFFRNVVSCFAKTGVFHCDMHSANVGVRDDGTFVLYDFGAVRRIDLAGLADPLTTLVALDAACTGNWGSVADAVVESGVVLRGRREVVADLLRACAEYAMGRADVTDLRPAFARAGGSVVVASDAAAAAAALATLEATCKKMNPDFDAAGAVGFPTHVLGAYESGMTNGALKPKRPRTAGRVARTKDAFRRRGVDLVSQKIAPVLAAAKADVTAAARTLEHAAITPLARFWELRERDAAEPSAPWLGESSDSD